MLDAVDKHILVLLSQDSRMPMKDLASSVGLSAPSTSERIRRLLEKNVLSQFSIKLDSQALGYNVLLLVYLRPLPGKEAALLQAVQNMPTLLQLERLTGNYPLLARLLLRELDDIAPSLQVLHDLAQWRTDIITQTLQDTPLPPCLFGQH